jgi:hypothetical protein
MMPGITYWIGFTGMTINLDLFDCESNSIIAMIFSRFLSPHIESEYKNYIFTRYKPT